MKLATKALTLTLIAAGGLAIAAEATNPAAKARQETMDAIGAAAKVLGDMAKGSTPHDAAAAAEAQAALAAAAATVTTLFEPNESDPKSKARPEIWTDWAGFQTKAEALVAAAGALDPSSLDGIKAGMGAIGGACGACHEAYRM
jgi:cytochrome c556